MTKEELQAAVDAVPYWYHRIELPHGIVTPGWAPLDASAYRIPDDLNGKRVLDVGAWDGYWTFEAVRRGASHAVAFEDFSDTIGGCTNADRSERWKSFCVCAKALGFTSGNGVLLSHDGKSTIEFLHRDIQQPNKYICEFTNVFAFGLLYHLQHPLLALQNMREMMVPGGTIHIETAILDGCMSVYGGHGYMGAETCFEFYPGAEYGRNPSNWWVGTLRAWCGLVEAAGFTSIESWKLTDKPTTPAETRGFIRAEAA